MSLADHFFRDRLCHGALTRRTCLTTLAAVAVAPAAARAEGKVDWHKLPSWRAYRREDLGFEIELPDEPEIEEEEDEYGRSINAELLFVGMMFGASHLTSKRALTIDDIVEQQRKAAQNLKARIMRETRFALGGFPAIEIDMEIDSAFASLMRAVVMGNRSVAITVTGWPDVADDPSAQRFLNSLKLLPVATDR